MRGVIAIVVLAGCGRLAFDLHDDAATSDVPGDATCTFGPWSTPVILAELNSNNTDFSPTLATDGLTIVFTSARTGGDNDIYMATRPDLASPFYVPQELTQLSTVGSEQAPSLSFDGLTLYYASNSVLHRATRVSLGAPFSSGAPVSELQGLSMLALEITAAGDELFYTRNAGIERATFAGGVFTSHGPVDELNVGRTCCPTLSHDGLTMFFGRDIGPGNKEILVATRSAIGASFGTATLVTAVNSVDEEDDPDLSDDGRTLIFASDRNATDALWASTRSCD